MKEPPPSSPQINSFWDIPEWEYTKRLWFADGPFFSRWPEVNFTVSEPLELAGTYPGHIINYYGQGLVTASAGRSVTRMNAQIRLWNLGKARLFTGSRRMWAEYGYYRYLKIIGGK